MLYVQDRMNQTLGVIDNYYNDTHSMILESGVSTYKFTIPKKEAGTELLVRGNYVVLADDKGQGWKFTIMSTDETHDSLDVECEDLGLELLNKVRNSWASPGGAQPFKYYFDKAVRDTGWTLGVNEISNLSRTLSWDGRDTALKRLLSICTQFDHAEIEFKVEFRNMAVVKQIVNVYKHRGADRSDTQLIYGDSVNDIRKTTEIRELATAIQGVGGVIQKDNPVEGEPEEHVDFSSLTYDDGEYFTPAGDPFLYARVANQQFNIKDTYLEDFYDYDTQDAQELLNRTLTQLKERCQPKVNYEVDLAKVDSSLNLGDTVTIIDHDYKPELLLSGRVLQLEKSYTDSSKNKATFGNFLILYSNISDQLRALQDQMNSLKPVANYMWLRYAKDDKGTGMTSTPTADTKYFAMLVNKKTGVPSDNPKDYAGHWKLIQGNDGKDGIPGAKGDDGKTSYTHFAYANNVSGTKDFSLDDPSGRSYMGVYSDFTKADSTDPSKYVWSLTKGETGEQGIQGLQGPQGTKGIAGPKGADGKTSYTHIAYANDANGGGFSQTPNNHSYIGMYVDFTENDSTDPKKYAWSLIKGANGANGTPGKPGADGKTPYFHTAWADSKDGKINFSLTDATNRGYLGTYTDFTQADSTDPAKYTWTELLGNLVIGGHNLLRNSKFDNEMAYWRDWGNVAGATRNIVPVGADWSGDINKLLHISNEKGGQFGVAQDGVPVMPNTEYTLSLLASGTGELGMQHGNGSTDPYGWATPAPKGRLFSFTFTTGNTYSTNIYIGSYNNGKPINRWITKVMLEKSNKPSDWSPSPEDPSDGLKTPNLVYNAGFKGDYKGGLDGWTHSGTGSSGWYRTMSPASILDGVAGAGVNGVTPTANMANILDSKPIPIDASNTFSASVNMRMYGETTAGMVAAAEIRFINNAGAQIGTNIALGNINKSDNNTNWKFLRTQNVKPTAAGATKVQMRIYVRSPNANSTAHVVFCQPVINYGATNVPYSDNQGSGGDISEINQGLASVNKKIDETPVPYVSPTAPISPKKGDQWWVKDASNHVTAFKQWDGSKWVDSMIQQSMLNIVTLNSVTLNSAVINSPNINVPFVNLSIPGFAEKLNGVMSIKDANYSIDGKFGNSGAVFHTGLTPDGWESYRTNTDGNTKITYSRVSFGELQLWSYLSGTGANAKYVKGVLSGQDAYRNSTRSVQWLGGWGDWGGGNGLITVTRNGRQVNITGYPHHNNTTTLGNVFQLPAWAKPANAAGINISATCYNSGVGNPTACKLFINKDGLVSISNAQKGGYVVIGQSYVGIDM